MARIAGIDLPKDKRIVIGLTYIYGLGLSSAKTILERAGVSEDIRVADLSNDDVAKIREVITRDFKVEGALRNEVSMSIKRLKDIGCYRGLRHRRNLPARGQRTHTNARTRRGRRTAVGGRKR